MSNLFKDINEIEQPSDGSFPNGQVKPNKKQKLDEEKIIYTSFLETKEYILEQVADATLTDRAELAPEEQGCSFIRLSKLSGEIDRVKYFVDGNTAYRPIIDETFEKGGIALPTGVKEYKDTKEIVDQIKQYLHERIQLPIAPINYERFLPYLALFYWVYEKFPFIPYIHFVGGTTSGKTTAMETFGSICYKPVDSSSSLTIASMFRIATSWKGTLLIDEYDSVGESSKELTLFLKSGVSNRLLYRVEGDRKRELKAYVVKSPKIFTSEQPITDAGLQSRTIVIQMEKNDREIPLYRLPEDYAEAQEIRNKLLLWRLRNINSVDLSKIRFGYQELKHFDKRVQQIVTPIYYFTDEGTRQDVLDFASEHERETLRSRREALDGTLFEMISDIWASGAEISIGGLTLTINENQKTKGYKNELSEKKIGNIVRKILGFKTERRGHDKSYWIVRNEQQRKVKQSYYGKENEKSSPSLSSASSEVPQKSDIIDEARDLFGVIEK